MNIFCFPPDLCATGGFQVCFNPTTPQPPLCPKPRIRRQIQDPDPTPSTRHLTRPYPRPFPDLHRQPIPSHETVSPSPAYSVAASLRYLTRPVHASSPPPLAASTAQTPAPRPSPSHPPHHRPVPRRPLVPVQSLGPSPPPLAYSTDQSVDLSHRLHHRPDRRPLSSPPPTPSPSPLPSPRTSPPSLASIPRYLARLYLGKIKEKNKDNTLNFH